MPYALRPAFLSKSPPPRADITCMATGIRKNLDTPPDLSDWTPLGTQRPGGPLSARELRTLSQASIQQKKVLRAAKVASLNGTCTAIFAACALVGGVFSTMSLVMGLALAGVAYNEFRGRKLLQQMDLSAPRVLGWNQVAFMGLLIGYAAWNMYIGLNTPSSLAAYPGLDAKVGITKLQHFLTVSLYGGLIVATIIFQGGCAWYYFTRTEHLRAYIAETAPWVMDVQRARDGYQQ